MSRDEKSSKPQQAGSSSANWHELVGTTPSGKTQFACVVCGRVTPAPSACGTKATFPEWHKYHGLTCEEVADREREEFLHPILKNAVQRSKVLAAYIRRATSAEARYLIQDDRRKLLDLVERSIDRSDFTGKSRRALQMIREAICNK